LQQRGIFDQLLPLKGSTNDIEIERRRVAYPRNELVSGLGAVDSLVLFPKDRPLSKRGGSLETS